MPTQGKIVQLGVHKLHDSFPLEELVRFCDAIDPGRLSQARLADPGASFCYKCPICQRVIHLGHVPQSARMHFAVLRGRTTAEFHTTINRTGHPEIIHYPRTREGTEMGPNRPVRDIFKETVRGFRSLS